MACEMISNQLDDEQIGQIYGILSVGCDRQTAASFVGCTLADIRRAMQNDATFAAGVCRAEAGVELNHMRNIQQAARDEKHWRASIWWLERRLPERFGPRGPNVLTSRQVKAFAETLVDALDGIVHNDDDRKRFTEWLKSLELSADRMARDDLLNLDDVAAEGAALMTEEPIFLDGPSLAEAASDADDPSEA
jgi:hypothetical protein